MADVTSAETRPKYSAHYSALQSDYWSKGLTKGQVGVREACHRILNKAAVATGSVHYGTLVSLTEDRNLAVALQPASEPLPASWVL